MVASCVPPTGDLAPNPGMCPDWESNWRPFGSQAGAQSIEPHQPGWQAFSIKGQILNISGFVYHAVSVVQFNAGVIVKSSHRQYVNQINYV